MGSDDPSLHATPGPVEANPTLASIVAEMLRVRLGLFSLELSEALQRQAHRALLSLLAAALLATGLMLGTVGALLIAGEAYRVPAVALLALLYGGAGAGLLIHVRTIGAAAPPPFAASWQELREDLEQIAGMP